MRFNKAIAAVLGLSMAVTPVLAQSAAPLAPVSRAAAATQDANSLDDDNYLLPGLVIAAILAAAILWASSKDSDHGNPVSP